MTNQSINTLIGIKIMERFFKTKEKLMKANVQISALPVVLVLSAILLLLGLGLYYLNRFTHRVKRSYEYIKKRRQTMKQEDALEKNSIKIIDDNLEFEMLSRGNTAEVYLYGDNEILKLFIKNMPFELIEDEYKIAEAVSTNLHNAPKVFAIVSYRARYGIIYERIVGEDMTKVMLSKLPKIKSCSKLLYCICCPHCGSIVAKTSSTDYMDNCK